LDNAADDHPSDIGGEEEHKVRCELNDQSADQHRTATDMVGERPQAEDGGEETDREDRERQREKRRWKPPLLLVEHQQRHQRACREVQTRKRDRYTRQTQSGGECGAASFGQRRGARRSSRHETPP
jgi:hypothetical protein